MEGVAYSLCDCNEILQEMGVKVDCMKAAEAAERACMASDVSGSVQLLRRACGTG